MSDSHSMSASNLQSLQSMAAGIDVSAPPKKKNKVSLNVWYGYIIGTR